jgi:hypothetical protein
LNCTERTLRANLRTRRDAGRDKVWPDKAISPANRKLRTQYGEEHAKKTVCDRWQYIYFTDEVYFNLIDMAYQCQFETRQRGSAQIRHLKEVPKQILNVTVHAAAGISYNGKGAFIFYHDPKEPDSQKIYKPARPRKSSVETKEQHLEAIAA